MIRRRTLGLGPVAGTSSGFRMKIFRSISVRRTPNRYSADDRGRRLTMRKLAITLLLAVIPALAHHSFDAEYDASKIANFTGVVTHVDWQNPHAFIFMNVKDESGATKNIRVELGPPYALIRGGWKKDTVKIGDTVTVEGGALGKDPKLNWVGAVPSTQMVLASGQKLTMR